MPARLWQRTGSSVQLVFWFLVSRAEIHGRSVFGAFDFGWGSVVFVGEERYIGIVFVVIFHMDDDLAFRFGSSKE